MGVVKWLRPRVVAPVYVSSNLTIHPINNFIYDAGVSPSGKAMDSDSIMRRFESYYPRHFFQTVSRFFRKLFCSDEYGDIAKW